MKKTLIFFTFISLLAAGWFVNSSSVYWLTKLYAQEKKVEAKPIIHTATKPETKPAPSVVAAVVPTGVGHPRIVKPEEYGNVILDRYASKKNFKPVVFPHWWHRSQYTCKVCHLDLGFKMQAGADDIKMADIFQGKWCGTCHNGKIAFAPAGPKGANCQRCHSYGIDVPQNRDAKGYLSTLPQNPFGNRVDWVKALDDGKIAPKASLDGKGKMIVLPINVIRPLPNPILPDVVYPHKPHTQVLACQLCHPSIFQMKAMATPMTMLDIFKGKFCGVCHGKVAFPVEDCLRCHSKK